MGLVFLTYIDDLPDCVFPGSTLCLFEDICVTCVAIYIYSINNGTLVFLTYIDDLSDCVFPGSTLCLFEDICVLRVAIYIYI